jgi:hypothetical protein
MSRVTLEEKLEFIEQTLAFYASESNYRGPRYISGPSETPLDTFSAVMQDRGSRARALLQNLHRDVDAHLCISSTSN